MIPLCMYGAVFAVVTTELAGLPGAGAMTRGGGGGKVTRGMVIIGRGAGAGALHAVGT